MLKSLTNKRSILLAVMTLCAVAGTPALGKDQPGRLHAVSVNVAAHDVDGLWSNHEKEGGVDLNLEVVLLRPALSLPLGTMRPNLGLTLNDRADTSKVYAGLLLELKPTRKIFVNLGIGLGLHNGETKPGREGRKALGSSVLFRIPVEAGYALDQHHRISVAFDHVSNAYLAEPNEGLDTLGLRYAYRF